MAVIGAAARRRLPSAPSNSRVWLLATLLSVVVGVSLSLNLKVGVALLAVLCCVPLILVDLRLGLVLWIPLPFLAGISALDSAGKAAGVLVAVAWIGALRPRRTEVGRVVFAHRRMFAAIAALCVWVTLSATWANSPSLTEADLWHWYAVGVIFLIVASSISSRRHVQLIVCAFVLGAVLSVAYGLAGGISGSEAVNAARYGGRLGGATGDPNFLAAGVVAALALTAGLFGSVNEFPRRRRVFLAAGLLAALAVLTIGLVASQSRGGLLACLVGVAASFVAFPRQRRWVGLVVVLLVGVAVVGFAVSPGALQRVTSTGNGSGRADEWTIALRIVQAHPVTGAGDANFVAVARDYTREPGALTEAQYLVDTPEVAHNTYLQFLSETGVVGLALFLAICGACLRAATIAARRFSHLRDRGMELLSRGVVVAMVAMLTASFFISAEVDQRLWVLLALGPALLALSSRRGAAQAERARVRR